MPVERPTLTPGEADPALTGEALDVDDPRQGERVPAVLGLDLEGAVAASAERLLELVRGLRVDVRAHDLTAVEADLDAHALLSHSPPAPRARRGRSRDARTRPRARRDPGAAPRRSARRPALRGPGARAEGR